MFIVLKNIYRAWRKLILKMANFRWYFSCGPGVDSFKINCYITLACAVEALDEAGALTFGSPENFWEVYIMVGS